MELAEDGFRETFYHCYTKGPCYENPGVEYYELNNQEYVAPNNDNYNKLRIYGAYGENLQYDTGSTRYPKVKGNFYETGYYSVWMRNIEIMWPVVDKYPSQVLQVKIFT